MGETCHNDRWHNLGDPLVVRVVGWTDEATPCSSENMVNMSRQEHSTVADVRTCS